MGQARTLRNKMDAGYAWRRRVKGRGNLSFTINRPVRLGPTLYNTLNGGEHQEVIHAETRFERHPTKGWKPATLWKKLKAAIRARA